MNPLVVAMKAKVVPSVMLVPGLMEPMESPVPETVICCEIVELLPVESLTVMLMLCVPMSDWFGVQLKFPL